MTQRRVEQSVAVVFRGPPGDLPLCGAFHLDQPAPGLMRPQEGAAGDRLILSAYLDGVMGQGRPKIVSPAGFTVVAVRAWIGEDVHSVETGLERKGVGVGVGGN